MAEEMPKHRVAKITLDEATRTRIAAELGYKSGLDAVPEEIVLVAVDPKDAGHAGDVSGFLDLRRTNRVFLNQQLTPYLSADRLARTGLVNQRRFVIGLNA
jgi:hypothetical protein